MKFTDLDSSVQESILELLNNHIAASEKIIQQDQCLIPMLMIPESGQLIGLQPKDGNTDVDKAYAFTIEKLKKSDFSYALFSYSTRIGLSSGKESDAIKTCIFTSNGIEVSFFTPYTLKGLFKKTINIGKTMIFEVKDSIFD